MALIDYKIPGPHWKLLVTIMPLASMTENPLQLHKQPVRNLKLNGSLLVSHLLTLLATIAACLAFVLIAPQLPFTRGPVRPNQRGQHEHAEAVWEMVAQKNPTYRTASILTIAWFHSSSRRVLRGS